MKVITDAEFKKFVSQNYAAVLFGAPWCGPCKSLEPHIPSVEERTGVPFAKVDVGNDERLAEKYGVTSLPTLILFSGGEPIEYQLSHDLRNPREIHFDAV
jgi:thioredoxin 1